MKFPSIQTLVDSALHTIRRFPLTVLFLLIGCFYAVRVIHLPYDSANDHFSQAKIIYCAYLGMLLALGTSLYSERKSLLPRMKGLFAVFTIILTTVYYFALPDHYNRFHYRQYILYVTGLHLLISFVPFIVKNEVNGFWQYNKTLFLRFLGSVLYSSVIYIGLSLAMLAIEKLFSVNISSKWYEDLWVLVIGIFNSLFFFAGIPAGFENLETKTDYPKSLKIFTQYVLLPLIVVYLVILYAYMLKIIATGQWPYGWVSYLILAFAIAGILSILLIHPIRYEAQNKWILLFSRFFYFAICPLIIMLFLAIERRIHEYGITEERYYVFILACWLAGITVYFLLSKTRNIKVIPVSLCIIVFAISFGPWSAFSVSFRSQSDRLTKFMQSNNMLNEHHQFIPATGKLHKGDATQIRSIIQYLVDAEGYQSLQPWFSQNLDNVVTNKNDRYSYNSYSQTTDILAWLKISAFEPDDIVNYENRFGIGLSEKSNVISLSGYEYMIEHFQVNEIYGDSADVTGNYKLGKLPIEVFYNRKSGSFTIKEGTDTPVTLDVLEFTKSVKNNSADVELPQDGLTINAENSILSVKFLFKDIRATTKNDSVKIIELETDILLHIKKPL
jgi:hypothetical protein